MNDQASARTLPPVALELKVVVHMAATQASGEWFGAVLGPVQGPHLIRT